MQENVFDGQFRRLKKILKCSSQAALAKKLGISDASISGAKSRQKIPEGWLGTAQDKYGVDPDYVLNGIGVAKKRRSVSSSRSQKPIVMSMLGEYIFQRVNDIIDDLKKSEIEDQSQFPESPTGMSLMLQQRLILRSVTNEMNALNLTDEQKHRITQAIAQYPNEFDMPDDDL